MEEAAMGTSLKILAAVSLAAALLFLGPAVVLADTDGFVVHCVLVTVVDPRFSSCDDQHPTIQDAVNHAEAEESVLVGAGTYPEQVTIVTPLLLEGAGATSTTIKPGTVTSNTSSLFSGAPIAAI